MCANPKNVHSEVVRPTVFTLFPVKFAVLKNGISFVLYGI